MVQDVEGQEMKGKSIKIILLIVSGIIAIAPWFVFADSDWILESKSIRSVIKINQVDVTRDEAANFEAHYDFLFVTGDKSYIRIPPAKIIVLEDMIFTDLVWSLPRGLTLEDSSLSISPKIISWSKNNLFESAIGEGKISTASGLSLDVIGQVRVTDNASLGENILSINLPYLSEIESQLDAIAIFPNDDIRVNDSRINIQTVNVHETRIGRYIVGIGKWVITFIGIAVFLVSLLFSLTESNN